MKIVVNDQVYLSEFRSSDKPALLQHINDRDIYDRTLRIPFPYTDASADEWLALVAKITEQQGRPVHFAIRTADDALIGGCGFDGLRVGKSYRAEIGYWLGKAYWGRAHDDRRGAAGVPARLRGVRVGEDNRPRLLAQPSVSPCPGKVRLPGGGLPPQAFPQGQPVH